MGSCDGQKMLAVNLIQDGDRRLKWPRREGKEMSRMKVARMKSPAKLSAEDPGIGNGDGNQPLLTAHSLGTRLPLPPPRSPEASFSQHTLKKGTLTLSCRNWKKRAAR